MYFIETHAINTESITIISLVSFISTKYLSFANTIIGQCHK
ncbi:hypothetical protein NUBL10699_51640 [Klebsiella pneumoniae]|nr:hypothetical protein NUBL10699_51640 [Klebsiella pneumoniae]